MSTKKPRSTNSATRAAKGSKPKNVPIRCRLPGASQFVPLRKSADTDDEDQRRQLNEFLLGSLQLQHLAVLSGSGTSLESDGPSMSALWNAAAKIDGFEEAKKAVNYAPGDREENIEELLSRCDALIQLDKGDKISAFRAAAIGSILELCRKAGGDTSKLGAHKELLRRLARRRFRDSRLKVFTTNYDRCFELAAGELGMVPLDGFSFSQPRKFDPRFFEYDIVRRGGDNDTSAFVPGVFQYFKLHGSVDWAARAGRTEIDPQVESEQACLIYPARTKFQRSFEQPHLEMMAQYLSVLREPNTCLVVVGFGFNDDHLSAPIHAALETNPHFRLIVVDPSAEERLTEPSGGWRTLEKLHSTGDVAFIEAKFNDFAHLIPDLKALSPAEDLARALRRNVDPSDG